MKLTTRDRWLLAVLPAIITGSVYLYGPCSTQSGKLKAANAELQAEQAKPFDPRVVNALCSDCDANQAALARARARAVTLGATPLKRIGPAGEDRSQTLRAVSVILETHGLMLVKSEKLDEVEAAMGKPALELWRTYAERLHAPAPQVWRVELRGTYPRVAEACVELSHAPEFVVPLSVSMEQPEKDDPNHIGAKKPATNLGGLKWTLTLWL